MGASRDPPLDPNHTHFVLADDGTVGQFGKEITLRSQFENYVAQRVGKENAGTLRHHLNLLKLNYIHKKMHR